jgi:hypothetical protein
MYFWNIKKLKAQLIARPLTERETLPYIIATALMYLILLEITIYGYSIDDGGAQAIPYGIWDYLSITISILITIFGSIWLFNKNKVRSENYFLQRYTALGWVVIVRTTVFVLFTFLILFALTQIIISDFFNKIFDSNISVFVFGLCFYLYFYWYFGKHLVEVAEKATYD